MQCEQIHDWLLSFTPPGADQPRTIAATVPGHALLDLQREGLAADPFPPDDLHANRAWEAVDDWTYRTEFDAPPAGVGERIFLIFDGIDTVAEVFLNGERVQACDNMFMAHEIEVSGRLKASGNRIEVRIKSASLHARNLPLDNFAFGADRLDGLVLRRARHLWGWDNAPRLPGAALWRPVRLEVRPAIRLDEVYVHTAQVTKDRVTIGLHYRLATPDSDLSAYRGFLRLAADGHAGHEFAFDIEFTAGHLSFTIPRREVALWWPRGLGEAALYEATVEIRRGGEPVALWRERLGIRELMLVYTDETTREGEGEFVFVCNGEKVFINGTNWKPLRPSGTARRDEIARALDLALDLHCNMIRVWGGGVYEDHEFFDYCDQNGLMVWQDFMFACALPPQDEVFQGKVAVEAEWIVKRLRNHPSLAVWCGDNEVDQSLSWGGRPAARQPSDNVINRQVLARAVALFDPHRVYVPSSPYFSDPVIANRRRNQRPWLPQPKVEVFPPDEHFYPTNEHFRDHYRCAANHFMSETGPFFINAMSQSPKIVERELPRFQRLWPQPFDPARYTLRTYQTNDDFLTWKDAAQKRLLHQFNRTFTPDQWQDLALGVNIVCGEMFKFAIEWSRSHKWRKTGVLWWSLLDMWPMSFNYSVVDAQHRPKQPCYDWIKQSQQPFCLMVVDPGEGPLGLFAANDTLQERSGDWRILAVDAAGHQSEVASGPFAIGANASPQIREFARPDEARLWIIEWTSSEGTGKNHFVTGAPPYDFPTYLGWLERITPTANDSQEINP